MGYNIEKQDCKDCNCPPQEVWATPHDPYGRRNIDRCSSCEERRLIEREEQSDDQ